jgi:hypothetical protein
MKAREFRQNRSINLSNAVASIKHSADSLDDSTPVGLPQAVEAPPARKFGPRELWEGWKKVARKIGDFQARVLMTIFYFVLLAPFALIVRRTSDPLAIKAGTERGWGVRQSAPEYTLEMARKQF